ncbi:DUF4383 domain-containing protein [Planosporangium flavigriseum]|uniref:Membrane protein n=1 Tax=Planosporangium flavigriseum TaxID=373681 RepID=A0A8J3LMT1_9ACTN|nr:DUF4383 domain-containing protein [Planosporangium flavigriseum]NJC67776.1 DUF4383 domain-containing protein [Planosporangium flavigriseum]GIG76058.1 membrane protein [Planosporangium flavigriseum]
MVTLPHPRAEARPLSSRLALGFGVLFLVIGILGFIPGITTNYGAMTFAGHHSGALLLGVFQVSILHNLVHLAFGAAGIAMARDADTARLFLVGGGAIYLLLWLYGLVINRASPANFIPLNTPDNWLHFLLGVAMVALGVYVTRGARVDRTDRADRR